MIQLNRPARYGLAALAAAGLAASGVTGALAAPRSQVGQPANELRLAVTDNGFYVDGPASLPAGRVMLKLDDAKTKGEAEAEILKIGAGYSFQDFRSDLKTAFENLFAPHGNKKKGLAALNHALDNVTAYGGVTADNPGQTQGSTVLLDEGQYVVFNDSGQLPKDAHQLTVGTPVGAQTMPTTKATVVALTTRRFSGSTVLPSHGYITFKNTSTESPHFLVLQHVKDGTTRKQVIEAVQSNKPPAFGLPESQDFEVVSNGHAEVQQLHLPAGLYAEMCFFPDPKTGMPHAAMGMVRMVHLK